MKRISPSQVRLAQYCTWVTPKSDCGHCARRDAVHVMANVEDHEGRAVMRGDVFLCEGCLTDLLQITG